MMESDNDFLKIMEGLVSNDSRVREKNLDFTQNLLKTITKEGTQNVEDLYSKIWRSFFYFFWNADKPVYQKKMAEKLANVFFEDNSNLTSELEFSWIKSFFLEFLKKWSRIDFLRVDKYIMLTNVIVKKFFAVNLQNENYEQILKIFDIINMCITSGHYNFSFVSIILKIISQFIDDIFKNNEDVEVKAKFLNGYFLDFFEKLLKIFIDVKDNRENNVFQDFIFSKISEKINDESINIINIKELKCLFVKTIFDFARSKDEYPRNKRKILYRIYKKMKYNKDIEEDEEEKEAVVDPVNQYTLNKNYTNKIKMSKLNRMKLMIERQKNQKRVEQLVKEKEKERIEKEMQIEGKAEVLKENVVLIDEEEKDEVSKEKPTGKADENLFQDSDNLEEEEEEEDDDDDWGQQQYHLGNSDSEEEEEEDLEEGEELSDEDEGDLDLWDDQVDYDDFDNEEEIDITKLKTKDGDLDPRLLYFFVDCDEEELKDLSEEDRKILEAYKNSQKNRQLLKASKKLVLKKRRMLLKNKNNKTASSDNILEPDTDFLPDIVDISTNAKAASINDVTISNVNTSSNKIITSEVKNELLMSTASKRKSSVGSMNSNNTSLKRKRRVQFRTNSNQFNEYDQLKPINLTSNKKLINPKEANKPVRGSLKSRNRNRK